MNPPKTLPLQPGEISFKEYVQREADRTGTPYRKVAAYIKRMDWIMDYSAIRRGLTGRAIAVRINPPTERQT